MTMKSKGEKSKKRRTAMAFLSKHMVGIVAVSGLLFAAVAHALPAKSDTDFTDNGDGTVTDKTTGLVWQQQDDGVKKDWTTQLQYCAGLNLGGHTDWRLPNIKELASLVDPTRTRPATFSAFRGVKSDWYGSSTSYVDSSYFWFAAFSTGQITNGVQVSTTQYYAKSIPYWYARCVRGGR
jgi:hypothetical protein